ncbi:hypothetical protein MPSEU_000113900 [Mayamaea pseudoterrestris]|nr:hypothetical protein MPSEU_000113900 [Mayamaea pseudoterrestris]
MSKLSIESSKIAAKNHEIWLKGATSYFHYQLRRIREAKDLRLKPSIFLLVAKDDFYMSLLRDAITPNCIEELSLNLKENGSNELILKPPSSRRLLACVQEVARMLSTVNSLKRLNISEAFGPLAVAFFTGIGMLTSGKQSELGNDNAATFRCTIGSIANVNIREFDFTAEEASVLYAFLAGNPIQSIALYYVSFPVACLKEAGEAIARPSLVRITYDGIVNCELFKSFCSAIVNSSASVLESMTFLGRGTRHNGRVYRYGFVLSGHGDHDNVGQDIDYEMLCRLKQILVANVQIRNSIPRFAAIGDAQNMTQSRSRLIAAMTNVDSHVFYEHLRTNKGNMIKVLQQLGRS